MSIFNTKKYIAAISGGPDSMALLHMYRRHIKAVCTVKYNKRPDCNVDVEIVKKMCEKWNIKFELLDVDQEIYDQVNDNNFQSKARTIRYDFFKEIAEKYNADQLLVAHQLDDFLETAYAQKSKKSLSLFYGVPEYSEWKGLKIYRPLIRRYRKATLQRYCDDFDIPYAIDSSNSEDIYERNRIRKIISMWDTKKVHEFLKEIDKYNKENKKVRQQIDRLKENWRSSFYDVRLFKTFDNMQKYYIIYDYLNDNGIYRPNRHKIEGIIEFITGMHGKEFRLNDHTLLIKNNGKIELKTLEKPQDDLSGGEE